MNLLIGAMLACLGCYFTAMPGRAISFRTSGHSLLVDLFDLLIWGLPYASIPVLLLLGMGTVLRKVVGQPRAMATKIPFVLGIPMIPLAVHIAMFALTYSTGSAIAPRMAGPLAVSECLFLFLGFGLIAAGFSVWRSAGLAPRFNKPKTFKKVSE